MAQIKKLKQDEETIFPITDASAIQINDTEKLSDYFKYSTTPQYIGNWVNGKPIYRLCFWRALTSSEINDKEIDIPISVKDTVINKQLFVTSANINDPRKGLIGENAFIDFQDSSGNDNVVIDIRKLTKFTPVSIMGYLDYIKND